jgi:hypothetical protein
MSNLTAIDLTSKEVFLSDIARSGCGDTGFCKMQAIGYRFAQVQAADIRFGAGFQAKQRPDAGWAELPDKLKPLCDMSFVRGHGSGHGASNEKQGR